MQCKVEQGNYGRQKMTRMRNLPCPQCDIHRFHVKNKEGGKFLVVTVNENHEVVLFTQKNR